MRYIRSARFRALTVLAGYAWQGSRPRISAGSDVKSRCPGVCDTFPGSLKRAFKHGKAVDDLARISGQRAVDPAKKKKKGSDLFYDAF